MSFNIIHLKITIIILYNYNFILVLCVVIRHIKILFLNRIITIR